MKLPSLRYLLLVFSFGSVVLLRAEVPFTVVDLGTLGGQNSVANAINGGSHNTAGMIVGSSAVTDKNDHAFLYVSGQMFDLNNLCDLSSTDFQVLSTATSINDSCQIIGEGLTKDGQKHAFLLTPTPVDGGQWHYVCCQWVWIQIGGGWWWESDCQCYKWHGPPGNHPECPPQRPHCWWWPLPCPPQCDDCTQPPTCWCCINGEVLELTEDECRARGGKCYASKEEALRDCRQRQTCWVCINGEVIEMPTTDPRLKNLRQCFSSREEAERFCKEDRNPCWVCENGAAVPLSEERCQQYNGPTYRSRQEALRNCQKPPLGWCCLNGVVQGPITWDECERRGGLWYPNEAEARNACNRQPQTNPQQPQPPQRGLHHRPPGGNNGAEPSRPYENNPQYTPGRPRRPQGGGQSPQRPLGRHPEKTASPSRGARSLGTNTTSGNTKQSQSSRRRTRPTPTPGKP